MLLRFYIALAVILGKGNSVFVVEKTCYRRIVSGKRLHEKYIRHSLPCSTLEACQHQCSIEKHFQCQGFNIRLDPDGIGKGICELSTAPPSHIDISRDFIFDSEFAYYERDYTNNLPNCGFISRPSETYVGKGNGGPYNGGDSYGPWSTGFGTIKHGPWGSHGYGSGFYESNNPSTATDVSLYDRSDFYTNLHQYEGKNGVTNFEDRRLSNGLERIPQSLPNDISSFTQKPYRKDQNRYNDFGKRPTYIIIDADVDRRRFDIPKENFSPYSPSLAYLPPKSLISNARPSNYFVEMSRAIQGSTFPDYYAKNYLSSGQKYFLEQKNIHAKSNNLRQPYSGPSLKPIHNHWKTEEHSLKFNQGATWLSSPQDGISRSLGFSHSDAPLFFTSSLPSHSPHSFKEPNNFPNGLSDTNMAFQKTNEVCFERAHSGYRLNQSSIKGMFDAATVLDCEALCTSASYKCTGYSFRYSSSPQDVPNCLLTDSFSLTRELHLLPDRSCDVYFKMSTCISFDRLQDAECFLKVAADTKIRSSRIIQRIEVIGLSDCEFACLSTVTFTCRSFVFRYGSGIIGESGENCFLSDWPTTALTQLDFVPSGSCEIYERGSYGHGCEFNMNFMDKGQNDFFADHPIVTTATNGKNKNTWTDTESWRYFTVNGWPCKSGSYCQLNSEGNFWSCEVEGGDKTQWDYCCRPNHSCGYSKGYNYPWCYVGEARTDQWRPCSEYYYPEFNNRLRYRPVKDDNPNPVDSYGPHRDARPWNYGYDFGPPNSWPISYFYSESPPNETIFAEDVTEHHHYHHHYHHHHHHYSNHELHQEKHPQYYEDEEEEEEYLDKSPKIRFKPCQKFPFPRAIVQKLDEKNLTNTLLSNKEVEKKDSKSLYTPNTILFKEPSLKNVKKEPYFELPSGMTSTEFILEKKKFLKNSTSKQTNKAKQVISMVDTIIRKSSTEKNETLKN